MILLHLATLAAYGLAVWWQRAPIADAQAPAAARRGGLALAVALVLHVATVYHDVVHDDGLDVGLANALSVVVALVAAVAWVSALLRTMPGLATIVLPLAAIGSMLPLLPGDPHRFRYLSEPWAGAHVGVALVAYAMFIVAAVLALLIMGLEARLHARRAQPAAGNAPPLLTLERLLFQLVAVGFALLTLTIGSGVLFSDQIFGRALTRADAHKSAFSALSWVIFGALLVGRYRFGWRGRAALQWILIGTGSLLLAYVGSKFVLEVILGRA
jgi:ABC-type uncharacterized transport system permease subunit